MITRNNILLILSIFLLSGCDKRTHVKSPETFLPVPNNAQLNWLKPAVKGEYISAFMYPSLTNILKTEEVINTLITAVIIMNNSKN